MSSIVRFATTLAAGAAAMYFLDPVAGRRRRAQARDRTAAACSDADHYVRGKCQHAAGRLQGVISETRSQLASHPIDDSRLHERIRARLGHLVDHAGAVEVQVQAGTVTLTGEVSEAEAQSAARAIGRMPGVASVENRLTIREESPSGGQSQAQAQTQTQTQRQGGSPEEQANERSGQGASSGSTAGPATPQPGL